MQGSEVEFSQYPSTVNAEVLVSLDGQPNDTYALQLHHGSSAEKAMVAEMLRQAYSNQTIMTRHHQHPSILGKQTKIQRVHIQM